MIIFLYLLFAVVVILTFLEFTMLFLVRNPKVLQKLSRKLQNSIGYLYAQGERKIMQFHEESGQYHPEFGYTLKPGEFIFTEREFSNVYFVNSLGVRDTEESLNTPEIIVAGDSYALGWGVNQEETFAKLLEQKINCKTLNMAVPSYGTVREMMMLSKVDRSKLKCLIIQYCGDDYDENMRFYINGNRPQIMRAETFRKLAVTHSRYKKYFFGKYLLIKIQKKAEEWEPSSSTAATECKLNDVDLFLHVLKQNDKMLSSLPIIVFEMNGKDQVNIFTTGLLQKAADKKNPPFIRNMIVLDMSRYLQDKHFYVLDGHLTFQGSIIVADVLYNTIKEAEII